MLVFRDFVVFGMALVAAATTVVSRTADTQVTLRGGLLRPEKNRSAPFLPRTLGAPDSVLQFHLSVVPGDMYNRIAYDVEYHNFLEEVVSFPLRRPCVFNLIVATLKTWAADMIVQLSRVRASRGAARLDWRRSATFALFGFLYVGLLQWTLLVSVMTRICPHALVFSNEPLAAKLQNTPGQLDLIKQVAIDNFVFEVVIYFPVFYVVKELVSCAGRACAVGEGLRKYAGNFVEDNVVSMLVWIPSDFVIFAVPMCLRLPLDHGVSFAWTMLLSLKRGISSQKQV